MRRTTAVPDRKPVILEDVFVLSLAQTDAPANVLIEKLLITREEFIEKLSILLAHYVKAKRAPLRIPIE